MAASPKFKIYNPDGEYVAACKYAEDAACLVAFYGNGATIRYDHHKPVWVEGQEEQPAENSYDFVAAIVRQRVAGTRPLAA